MNVYSIAYGIGAAILVYLSYLVFVRTPKSDAKFYFLLLTVGAAIWIFSEFLYYTTGGLISLIFYHIKFVGIITVPYAFLFVTLTVPIRSKLMKINYFPVILFIPALISMIFLFTNPLHHLFFSGFRPLDVGDGITRYTGVWGPLVYFWHVPYSYFCLLWGFVNILFNLGRSRTKLDYYFLFALFFAIVIPVIMNVLTSFVWNLYPDPTSLTIVFSAGEMAYLFSRYKMFQLPKHIRVSGEKVANIERGKNYIVNGDGYSILKNLSRARPLLIISTRDPDWVRETIGKDDVPVIWLSEVSSEYSILPERLEFEIEYTAIEFWRQNPGGVVAIDGVGYLSAFNSSDRLMMFIKDLIDSSSNYDGTLLLINTDMFLMDDEIRSAIEGLFDRKLKFEGKPLKYHGIVLGHEMDGENYICVSSENPEKHCGKASRAIWVRRGGRYTPDTMRMDVLYEIEEALSDGLDLLLHKPEGIFIGWKETKIYTYLKLLSDLAVKYGRRVHISGNISGGSLGKIISMFH